MDSFDMERLQVYRRKVFDGAKLTEDQRADLEDLKKRHADVLARKVLKEEREEMHRQAEHDRKAQRELFQQQRELLLLSRRVQTRKEKINDFKDLPRVVPLSSNLLPHLDINVDNTSNPNSCSDSNTKGSTQSSPTPSPGKSLSRVTSVPKLYASAKRTPTSIARAETLNLQQKQREVAAQRRIMEEELARKKLDSRRDKTASVGEARVQANETVNTSRQREIEFVNSLLLPVRPVSSKPEVDGESSDSSRGSMHATFPVDKSKMKMHVARLEQLGQQCGDDDSETSVPSDSAAVYIETFDVMFSDIKGPLGSGCGGLRRYFFKLLESFVTTGCIYRTANKIGICVHGTGEVLDMVRTVLDHAMNHPPVYNDNRRMPHVKWKYSSTGRTLRQGVWRNHFVTRLCENARRGNFSPRDRNDVNE